MCTVTIVPVSVGDAAIAGHGPRFRMVCNRDERLERSPAAPPRIMDAGHHRVIMPTDGDAGGTWVAVNDAGLCATLLNLNLRDRQPQARARSRGQIIPPLMSGASAAKAAEKAMMITPEDYEPFRLIVADAQSTHLVRSDGQRVTQQHIGSPGEGPMMFTSSGLGDHLVEAPRRELFERMFATPPATWLDVQARFHRHRWDDRLRLSVCMSRDDARTVSITRIDVGNDVTMRYWTDPLTYPTPEQANVERLGGDGP